MVGPKFALSLDARPGVVHYGSEPSVRCRAAGVGGWGRSQQETRKSEFEKYPAELKDVDEEGELGSGAGQVFD